MNKSIDELQATYDRLNQHRRRVLKYYDESPDGDPRKYDAEIQLDRLGRRIYQIEQEIDKRLDDEEGNN
jgi:hypothetical protein